MGWGWDAIWSLRARRRSARLVSRDAVLSGPVVRIGPVGEDLFEGDGWEHLAAAVTAAVVVGVDEPGDVSAGLVLALEVPAGEEFVLEGRVEALRDGVVERGADPAHRLGHAERVARPGEEVADVLASLVAVEDHTGGVAAAH